MVLVKIYVLVSLQNCFPGSVSFYKDISLSEKAVFCRRGLTDHFVGQYRNTLWSTACLFLLFHLCGQNTSSRFLGSCASLQSCGDRKLGTQNPAWCVSNWCRPQFESHEIGEWETSGGLKSPYWMKSETWMFVLKTRARDARHVQTQHWTSKWATRIHTSFCGCPQKTDCNKPQRQQIQIYNPDIFIFPLQNLNNSRNPYGPSTLDATRHAKQHAMRRPL